MTHTPRGTTTPISIAPMMDATDRHLRWFFRLLTRRTLLYTEMITTAAVLRGRDRARLLGFSPEERPLSLQLGGDDPAALAECARIAADLGYDEVNLNVGCPSSRVQEGRFGACLMAEPERVARAVEAMRAAVPLPVTVKHRIGVDDQDRYEDMAAFVRVVSAAGADRFTVHARKAWLTGLSPKQNRTVPPLRYEEVYRLKQEHPWLRIELNGGVTSLDQVEDHLRRVDAVMLGRAATDDPYLFADVDRRLFGETRPAPSREEAVLAYVPYVERRLAEGDRLTILLRPLHNLFAGRPGARRWRQAVGDGARSARAGPELLREALASVSPGGVTAST